jgi:hypothetical protein
MNKLILCTLLGGSGYLKKTNNKIIFFMKKRELEYVKYVHKNLNGSKIKKENNYYIFWVKADFNDLYEKWYVNERKITPNDLVLDWEVIAHYFIHKGYNNVNRRTIVLTKNDLIISKFNNYKIYGNKIYIKDYYNFINNIRPYIPWKCFQYKLVVGSGKGRKLDESKAREIRKLYFSDLYTQKELGRMYGVSQPMIAKVVNNMSYPSRSMNLCGSSPVEVRYNY